MGIGYSEAARGAPGMAFWPTTAAILVYSESPTPISVFGLVVMMFVGSMTYLTMRQIKRLVESTRNKASTKKNVIQRNESLLSRHIWRDATQGALEILPNSTIISLFIAICVLMNFIGGVVYLVLLIDRAILSTDPQATAIGVTILPILYLFVVLSVLIWNH